jgi:hypothetical protein
MLAIFTILLSALAITGYTYSTWLETLKIHDTSNIAELSIYIQNYNTTQTWQISPNNHTLELTGSIRPNQTIWTGIIIKNNGTTPAAITYAITTNNTNAGIWFSNQTHFYGPYATDPPPGVWNNAPTLPPSDGSSSPPELPAQNKLVAWQNITLNINCPQGAFTAIEMTVAYTATFQTWTDTVYVKYTLTYQPP